MAGYAVLFLIMVSVAAVAAPALNYTKIGTFLSLQAAILAFVLMALSQFMAARPRFVESMFGGLDKLYVAHRRIGYAVLALILVHYLKTPDFKGLFLNKELNDLAREFGTYAFYALCALITLSIVKWIPLIKVSIPYNVWYITHRFVGFAFAALAFHQFFIKKPFDQSEPIALVINCFAALGMASFAYTQALAHFRKRDYRVISVVQHPSATIVTAKPMGRPLKLARGQFAILHARRPELREPHPFTVAGIGTDGSLKFAIKPAGDFTKRLREHLRQGDILRLEGGYGRFDFKRGGDRQLWIAGGIGVTPFMSMLSDLKDNPRVDVTMVYCVRDKQETIDLDNFVAADEQLPNFKFILHASADNGRLDAKRLAEIADLKPGQSDLFFCGPAALRRVIVDGLEQLGMAPRRVWFERFEFR
ncbi:ferric reductase-like transmembrane domain-containing protein [Ensifer aridi]|uniref:ferredoxin reductase family protein n=1 Tax=Ensifer aridi TaxID=1708715 RepID=UPI001FCE1EC5|nr:ferric reductase-like transmembrane domain-containing protein [Ensifer aridi]